MLFASQEGLGQVVGHCEQAEHEALGAGAGRGAAPQVWCRACPGAAVPPGQAGSRPPATAAGRAPSAPPVLIVSTKGMEVDMAWGMRQGARDYMVKPVKEAELVTRINALLEA